MKGTTKNIGLNVILNSIRTIMSVIFPLITYPYVTRILQPENIGKLNFANSYIGYFSLIAVLGITSYASREGAQYRDDKEKFSAFASQIFTLNVITTLVSYTLLTLSVLFIPKLQEYQWALIIYSLTILFSTMGLEWVYNIYEDYLYITIRSIVMQILSLILMFLFVKSPKDMYIYASLNVLASVGGNIWNFFRAKKYLCYKFTWKKETFAHLKGALVFFSSSLASSIYSNIDITMLGGYKDDWTVGIYSAAVKFYSMLKMLILAIINVTIPRLTYYKAKGEDEEYNKLLSKLVKIVLTIVIPMVIGIIIIAEDLMVVCCGQEYQASGICLQLLSIAVILSIFATITNGCILIVNKLEKKALFSIICAAIVNVILNLFMIPLLGAVGAAITTIIAELTVLGIGWHYARKLVKLQGMTKTVILSIVASLLMFIPGGLFAYFIDSIVLRLCLTVVTCVLLYFIISLIFRNEVVVEGLNIIKNKFKKKDKIKNDEKD